MEDSKEGGCFRSLNPNIIYLSPGLLRSGSLQYVVFHEYAHVLQHQNSQFLDECAADRQAAEWGANVEKFSGYDCEIPPHELKPLPKTKMPDYSTYINKLSDYVEEISRESKP